MPNEFTHLAPTGFPLGPSDPEFGYQEPTETAVASYVQAQIGKSEPTRTGWLVEALLNRSMYVGRHYIYVDPRSNRLYEYEHDDTPRSKADLYSTYVDQLVSRLNVAPGASISPATYDDEDVQAARACEAFLEHVYATQSMSQTMDMVIRSAVLTGAGLLFCDPEPTEEGPQITYLDPLDFWADPGATTLRSAQWCCSREYVHISQLRLKYPNAKVVSPGQSDSVSQISSLHSNDDAREYLADRVPLYIATRQARLLQSLLAH